ncbi:MAG: class I SAM-dependent methyltransferase [Elusimicrobia bacterium]|nr:class I SAM-dependent methyltransferase [Elusimicrobiota bacterium]
MTLREACDEGLARMFLDAPGRRPDAELRFLWRRLRLFPGCRVLDQGCGTGRLALRLARRGARVVGVDHCRAYVERARALAREAALPCVFRAQDASRFTAPARCDAAINWYSSFGQSPRVRDDLRVLRRAFESLRPGGRLALDWPNMAASLARFERRKEWRRAAPEGLLAVRRECALDLRAGLIRLVWTCRLPDGRGGRKRQQLRLYLPHQLAALAREAGFSGVQLLGGLRGQPLTAASPRCILLAARPG